MRIDNSAFQAFFKCPQLWAYQFVEGISKPKDYLNFGSRIHNLLENYYKPGATDDKPDADAAIENEALAMFERYKATYPTEPFDVIETERSFELAIPGTSHYYLGKIDMTVRDQATGKLNLFETKTEKRGSKRNVPEAWAARTQVSLYKWAAEQIYQEPVDKIILNICTRQSPKGNMAAGFRRDLLERTEEQVERAMDDLKFIANHMDRMAGYKAEYGALPRNTNSCISDNGYPCDFYSLCHLGDTPELRSTFVQVAPFAHLEL